MQQHKQLLKFPCTFPIKIIGWANVALEDTITPILHKNIFNFDKAAISVNYSHGGKYISITVKFEATNREQIDNLYSQLSATPDVLLVL